MEAYARYWLEVFRLPVMPVERLVGGMRAEGPFDKAFADLNEAIRLDPDNAPAYRARGKLHQQLGETQKAQARNSLLVVIFDVANARTYLAQKDGAKLISALDKARTDLDVVQPYILGVKKDLSDELNSRMETVRSVVVRDSTLAQSDLENLYTALLAANDVLFGPKP